MGQPHIDPLEAGHYFPLGDIAALSARLRQFSAVPGEPALRSAHWFTDSTLYIALALAGFTIVFGARHLDSTERHEGMVAAIAFESIVKLLAFLAVGGFVVWGLFDGLGDLFARALAVPELARLLTLGQGNAFALAIARQTASWADGHFNPIFFCGPYGYGKTHLLNAIAWGAMTLRKLSKSANRFW